MQYQTMYRVSRVPWIQCGSNVSSGSMEPIGITVPSEPHYRTDPRNPKGSSSI